MGSGIWIELHVSLMTSPKATRLARALKTDIVSARGALISLWLVAAEHCPDGDLSKLSAVELAEACGWPRDPKMFLKALVDSGWIDKKGKSLRVHDWSEYGLRVLNQSRERQRKFREAQELEQKKDGEDVTLQERNGNVPGTSEKRPSFSPSISPSIESNLSDPSNQSSLSLGSSLSLQEKNNGDAQSRGSK